MSGVNSVLITARPGNEFRLFTWIERNTPWAFTLFDGSGLGGQSRVESSRRLFEQLNCTTGSLFGEVPDQEAYQFLLAQQYQRFLSIAQQLREFLINPVIEVVAAEAAEGFSPLSDLCRMIVDAAVTAANAGRSKPVRNYAFSVYGSPGGEQLRGVELGEEIVLSPGELERKFVAAFSFADLKGEVEGQLAEFGRSAFERETLWLVSEDDSEAREPKYERRGAELLKLGRVPEIIRFQNHLEPIQKELRAWATE